MKKVYPVKETNSDNNFESLNQALDEVQVINGVIRIPGIFSIKVEGLLIEQAKEEIQNRLREIYNDVDVTITFTDKPSGSITLLGNIGISSLSVTPTTRLFDVLSQGRLSSNTNYFTSYVLRNGRKLPVDM